MIHLRRSSLSSPPCLYLKQNILFYCNFMKIKCSVRRRRWLWDRCRNAYSHFNASNTGDTRFVIAIFVTPCNDEWNCFASNISYVTIYVAFFLQRLQNHAPESLSFIFRLMKINEINVWVLQRIGWAQLDFSDRLHSMSSVNHVICFACSITSSIF